MSAEDFEKKYAITPAYLTESNDYFELVSKLSAVKMESINCI